MARSFRPLLVVLAACPAPQRPHEGDAAALTIEVGAQVRGAAGDDQQIYAALAGPQARIEARRGEHIAWTTPLTGSAGPLARTEHWVVAAVTGTGSAGGGPVRGEPGAALVALDPENGAQRWRLALDATQWATVAALSPAGDDAIVVGGAFAGTLRVQDRVVTSAGGSDGFVARVTGTGAIQWLVRVGGAGADAVQGVAARGDRVVLAGTFTAGAELLGQRLPAFDERSPASDAFAAELDAAGARRWFATFGGKANDVVAGIAIDREGRVAVAGTARDTVHVGSTELVARGAGDALVVWITPTGEQVGSILLGGADFDGVSAIAAVGDRVVVGGFFSGSLRLGDRTLTAGGGDDSWLAELDPHGTVARAWQIGGEGREEITALAALPGGFVAGIAHTARASIDGQALSSSAGAALIVRGGN